MKISLKGMNSSNRTKAKTKNSNKQKHIQGVAGRVLVNPNNKKDTSTDLRVFTVIGSGLIKKPSWTVITLCNVKIQVSADCITANLHMYLYMKIILV